MNIRVAIADTNNDYAHRLFDVISEDKRFTVSLFTDCEKMALSLSQKKYDVILLDKSMLVEAIKNVMIPILLVDSENVQGLEQMNNIRKINKYQRISQIVRLLMDMYAEQTPNVCLYNSSPFKTIVVYSPVGGCGKTTISVALAMTLAKSGQRVLYLDMEEYSTIKALFGNRLGKGLSEVFEKLGSDINHSAKLQSLLHSSEGVNFFNPFDNIRDLSEINETDIESFFDEISNSNLFDIVVIDMSSAFSKLNSILLQKADIPLLVTCPGVVAEQKLNILTEQLDMMDRVNEKMKLIVNRCKGSYSLDSKTPISAYIEEFCAGSPLEICRNIAGREYFNYKDYIH